MGTDLQQSSFALSDIEIDAIGEVLNISMGSAATAVSTMLDKQVVITTPKVSVESVGNIDYSKLEPALVVKITYTEGIDGSNVMVFSQRDMQLILNQLMGIDDPISDDFVFDDLSMSAACEIMNQMMGASATALSNFLGKTINISTPTATIMTDNNTFLEAVGVSDDKQIVSVLFKMTIGDIMDSEFVSCISCDLAKSIVGQFLGDDATTPIAPPPPPPPSQQPQQPQPQQYQQPPQQPYPQPAAQQPPPQQQYQQPPMGYPPPMDPMQQPPMGYPPPMDPMQQQQYYQPYPPPGYPPYGGYQQPYPQQPMGGQPVRVQSAQFPEFSPMAHGHGIPMITGNMDLIMNVPLSVSVEIGSTKRKIKDILEFNQGTVVELEKQAGAPVDVVVNGQLFARGDVVVMDDNFGVRITEIIGTKELLNSLENGGAR